MSLPFDQTSAIDIERYGKRLVDKTLRTQPGAVPLPEEMLETEIGGRTRGSFGTLLERYYYGINPGNESAPDFPDAGVELKSTPLKKLLTGSLAAKERLVLNIINYEKEAEVEAFDASSFLRKNATIMLVSYEHESGRAAVDHPVRIAQLLSFNELPLEDQRIIEEDWELIAGKIRAGQAHELHEGETRYLSACTKAADSTKTRSQANGGPPAKPRAFSFKAGYMTVLMQKMLAPEQAEMEYEAAVDAAALETRSFEDEVLSRFTPYVGKSVEEIQSMVGDGLNTSSKDYYAMLARRMIGVKGKKIEEFEKAEIAMKTVQLKADGMPKEDMSFPGFRFLSLLEQDWEAADIDDEKPVSAFKKQLERRFLFVVYQCDADCKTGDSKRLLKAFFWTMPPSDIDGEAKRVWLRTVEAVQSSDPSSFPKLSESDVAHVRPKAANKDDDDELPDGSRTTKRCFWLNKTYIRQQIDAA